MAKFIEQIFDKIIAIKSTPCYNEGIQSENIAG